VTSITHQLAMLVLGKKQSKSKYINERCKLVVGKTAEEAVGTMVPNSKGKMSRYSNGDLQYDIKGNMLVLQECSETPTPKSRARQKKKTLLKEEVSAGEDEDEFEEQLAGIDPDEQIAMLVGKGSNGNGWYGPSPKRDTSSSCLLFEDAKDFRPNLSPKEVLQLGSFGGGYFRSIYSKVTGKSYDKVWEELPSDWIENLDVATQVASVTYSTSVNKYKVNCGGKVNKADAFGQQLWEQSGWIEPLDPYGWFMWYCRFYQGRRSDDDSRQIGRWCKCAGAKGRWKQNLVGKCLSKGVAFDDEGVSPVVRQTLQHWGYRLTGADFELGAKRVRMHGASYMPKSQLKHVMEEAVMETSPRGCGGAKKKSKTEGA
jgi:hypothetical protein